MVNTKQKLIAYSSIVLMLVQLLVFSCAMASTPDEINASSDFVSLDKNQEKSHTSSDCHSNKTDFTEENMVDNCCHASLCSAAYLIPENSLSIDSARVYNATLENPIVSVTALPHFRPPISL